MLEYTSRNNGGLWLRDFDVLYRAGGRIVSGQPVFQPARDGFYSYKYSPTAALYFIPFSLFPLAVSGVLYWLFTSALVLTGFYLSLSLVFPGFRSADPGRLALLLLAAGLIMGIHIWAELTLGQVNHLLLVMYIAMAWLFVRGRAAPLSLLWALSLFIKPFGLIFVPYFVLRKRFRELAWLAGFTGLLFVLPALFYGGAFLGWQHAWYSEIAVELGKKADLFQAGNHTLVSVLARYSPLAYLRPGPQVMTVYEYTVLGLVVALALWLVQKGRNVKNGAVLDFAFFLVLAPLLSYTNSNGFGMVELAVFLVLFNFGKLRLWEKVMATAAFLLIGGNFYNQLPWERGAGFYIWYDSLSLLGIGAILLLVTLVSVRRRAVL